MVNAEASQPKARPRIVLTLSRSPAGTQREVYLGGPRPHSYIRAVTDAGADAIPVLPGDPEPDGFDALLLTGGGDVDPDIYGGDPKGRCEHPDRLRDDLELRLLARAHAAHLPILGICRGLQVINVGLGGRLLQHIEGHRPASTLPLVPHLVSPISGTQLARICGPEEFSVNSHHHQAVTDELLGEGLQVSARVDGLAEALESPSQWIVAVQWHPERAEEVSEPARRIFPAFVEAARRDPR